MIRKKELLSRMIEHIWSGIPRTPDRGKILLNITLYKREAKFEDPAIRDAISREELWKLTGIREDEVKRIVSDMEDEGQLSLKVTVDTSSSLVRSVDPYQKPRKRLELAKKVRDYMKHIGRRRIPREINYYMVTGTGQELVRNLLELCKRTNSLEKKKLCALCEEWFDKPCSKANG